MKLQPQSTLGSGFGAAAFVSKFESNTEVLRERADIGCILLTTAVLGADVASPASDAAGIELPWTPGAMKESAGRTALWLSPRSWLIHCAPQEEMELVCRINEAFPDKLVHAVPFTDALCWFELSGDGAIDLLTDGGFISLDRGGLPIGHAKRTLIAQVTAVIVRQTEIVWLLGIERSRAQYFVDWLTAAAQSRD